MMKKKQKRVTLNSYASKRYQKEIQELDEVLIHSIKDGARHTSTMARDIIISGYRFCGKNKKEKSY